MSVNLPSGWTLAKIGEITEYVQRGKGPKYSEKNEFPVINQKSIRWHGIEEEHLKYVQEKLWVTYSKDRFIRPGDILWNSTGTGTIGRACLLNDIEAAKAKVVDSHVTIVRVGNTIDPRYLFSWIKSPAVQLNIDSLSTGTTNQVELSKSKILESEIPLAPLNEQVRISEKLDILLKKVDAIQARLEKIPYILKRFRQSVLAAATSRELTKDLDFSDESYYKNIEQGILKSKKIIKSASTDEISCALNAFNNPDWGSWKFFALEQLVDPLRGIPYGIVQTGDAQQEGVPTVRCGDVRPLSIRTETLKRVTTEIESKYVRTRLLGKEVLLAIRGTVGNASAVTEELSSLNANISREVAMIPVRDDISPQFIAILLQSPGGFKCLAENVRGVAQKGINLSDVRRFTVPLPTLDEQAEIVRRVESLLTLADVAEKQYTESKKMIDRLSQSLLAKAFRGELVTQDPSDEPAVELIRRINSERVKSSAIEPTKKPNTRVSIRKSSSKVTYMKMIDAPHNYLLNLLSQLGGEAHPNVLWSKTDFTIDDFYAKLKQEMQAGHIIDDNVSSDPALRKLKLGKPTA
ncbi:restriction endonuclease subunit S [uncultured Pseudomonas sp.]|uniref:restriction endonuclease subunit S n=1 Tax=uncultured Pseudomonas sp. TaxID=114707 RepID=UPI0025E14D0B|nr:restriction endonuclease subunit S [uncultured Pseudomonas sp.]